MSKPWGNWLWQNIAAALAYGLCGYFGSWFSIEPGFASAVWPAAGVALAIHLKYGRRILLGLFIGAMAANFITTGISLLEHSFSSWLWTGARSGGAIVQVMAARWLLMRSCQLPLDISTTSQFLKVLLHCGPIACVISSSIGSITLYWQGVVDINTVPFVWFTWWVGDSVGVLFFLPVTIALMTSSVVRSALRRRQICVSAGMMFLVVCGLFQFAKADFQASLNERFSRLTSQELTKITIATARIRDRLNALSALIRANPATSRHEFGVFSADIYAENQSYRAMGWLPKIEHADLPLWLAKINSENSKNVKLRTLTSQGLIDTAPADYYLPITYIEPLAPNITALGLDVNSHFIASHYVTKCIETNQPQATPLLNLVQASQKFTGNVVYYPVLSHEDEQLLGIVAIVFEMDVFLDELFPSEAGAFVGTRIVDGMGEVLFEYRADDTARYRKVTEIDWFGQQWKIEFTSTGIFENAQKDWVSWFTLICGMLFSVGGMAFIFMQTGFAEQLSLRVEQQTCELKELIAELENANKAQNTFIANMSHELRTPLNAIIGFVTIAHNKIQDSVALGYFQKIEHSSSLLLNAINQVLDFTKINAGKLQLDMCPFDLNESVARITAVFGGVAEQQNLAFTVSCTPETLPTICGDQARIEQIITNLLGNAMKFTERGEVTLRLSVTEDRELLIQVNDQGIGISKELQARLFEQFEQADKSTTRRYGGTGLGLSITKALCLAMNGTIDVVSEEGRGTCFTVTLPVELAKSPLNTNAEDVLSDNDLQEIAPFLVLVVEDNRINQVMMEEVLQLFDVEIRIANNGQNALDILDDMKGEGRLPDLILMDIQMPIMDGFTATERIVADENLKLIPVAGLSANATTGDIQMAKEKGMIEYLTKPIDVEALKALIDKYRGKH